MFFNFFNCNYFGFCILLQLAETLGTETARRRLLSEQLYELQDVIKEVKKGIIPFLLQEIEIF